MKKLYNRINKAVKWNVYVWKYCAKRNSFYKNIWKFFKKTCFVINKLYSKPFTVSIIGMAGMGFTTAGLVFLDIPVAVVFKMLVVCAFVAASGLVVAGITSDDEAWR